MIRSWRRLLLAILAGGMVLALAACQPAPKVAARDSGLVPPPGSTGSPPPIPHDVDAADSGTVCLECHKTGEGGAPKTPEWHAGLVDCRECHIRLDEQAVPFAPRY